MVNFVQTEDLSAEDASNRKRNKDLHKALFAEHNPNLGILKHPVIHGKKCDLLDHQHDFIDYIVGKESETNCTTTVVNWPTGSGKTIGWIAVMAMKYLMSPDKFHFRALYVTTPTHLDKAVTDITNWTTWRVGKEIAVIRKQQEFADINNWGHAHVIVCSYSTLEALEMTFWHHETYQEKIPGTNKRGPPTKPAEWIRKGPDPQFYTYIESTKLDICCIDECHNYCGRDTYKFRFARRITHSCLTKIGMTATPVKNDPKEPSAMCAAINAEPEELQIEKRWLTGGKGINGRLLRKTAVKLFHAMIVHKVCEKDAGLQVDHKLIDLEYWPFIGRREDGTMDEDFIDYLNDEVDSAKTQMFAPKPAVRTPGMALQTNKFLMKVVATGIQAPTSKIVAKTPAAEINHNPELYMMQAIQEITPQMLILHKLIRSRQLAGKGRILVYWDLQGTMRHAANAMHKLGQCGRIVPFDSNVPIHRRQQVIDDFLSPRNPRGVFMITRAGEESITLCGPKGRTCSVLIQCASDWSPESDTQLHGRLLRCVQEEDVEIIRLTARHGMTAAKRSCHFDKSARVAAPIKDMDFTGFRTDDDEEAYRKNKSVLKAMTFLNRDGNYNNNPDLMDATQDYEDECVKREEAGRPPPPPLKIDKYSSETPQLPHELEIPPVTYPVPGFDPDLARGSRYDTIACHYSAAGNRYHQFLLDSDDDDMMLR